MGGLLAVVGSAPTAQATQATGHDVPTWATGWSWTYASVFHYKTNDGTDVTMNENVVFTNAGPVTFQGQDAYKLNLSGTITGGSGSVYADGVGTASLSKFSGTVTGTRYVRRSDLALLQESQQQHLNATASLSIISQGITADINLQLTPQRGWETHDFPLNPGDSYNAAMDVDYTGGFNYDAGSIGGSGSSPFDGTFSFDSPSAVTSENVSVGVGTVAADKITSISADGRTQDVIHWSPNHKNDAREYLKVPMSDEATNYSYLEITRSLSATSLGTPGTTINNTTITPSLSCAGGTVTVTGQVSSFAAGVPVTVSLDRSPVSAGAATTANTTTTSGGGFSATLTAPSEADGLGKNGARATWGVLVSAGGATGAATLVVTPQACSSLTYTGDTAAQQGTGATVSAKLTDLSGGNAASGKTIAFSLSGGATVNATTNAAGVATATLPVGAPPRSATISASYAGSTAIAAASTTAGFDVAKIATSTAVVANPPIVTVGDPVTFTAEVTPDHGAAPSGSVQFNVDGANFGAAVPLSNGSATSAPISTLAIGYHDVIATFTGTADHAASTSTAFTFRVRQPLVATTTSLDVDTTAAVYGEPVTLSAHVAGSGGEPTGPVTFKAGTTTLGSAGVDANGDAVLVSDTLPVGTQAVTATYEGDDVYGPSTSGQKNVTVSKAAVSVTLTATDDTTVSGEAVGYSATVGVQAPGGGTPTGTVRLLVDGNQVGTGVALDAGTATFPAISSLGAGQHTVRAVYDGSATHGSGSDELQQTVTAADTSVSALVTPSPANEGQSASVTATVAAVAPGSGAPTGTVSFTANGEDLGAAPLTPSATGSTATLDVSDLAPGSYAIVASYAGDNDYNASTGAPVSHTVIEGAAIVGTTTSVSSSSNPSTYGQLISFTAHVDADDDSAPAGVVQFSLDGTDFGDPVAVDGDGNAESVSLGSPDPGDHTVIAEFVADPGYSGSGDILLQTVDAAAVDLGLSTSQQDSTVTHAVRFTATVASTAEGTGDPTGHVQFVVDGQPLAGAVAVGEDGVAQSQLVSDLEPGAHTVAALYSGDAHFAARSATIEQRVKAIGTTTTLTTSASSTTYGQSVTLTAKVTPADNALGSPVGSLRFVDGSTVLATLPLAAGPGDTGVATFTTSALGAGSHSIKAVYVGTQDFDPSTSAAKTVSVAKIGTTLVADAAVVKLVPLGLPLGQLRATLKQGSDPLAGVPLVFKVGAATVCTSTTDATGAATCNGAGYLLQLILNAGYTVSYAGDADHVGSSAKGVLIK